MKLSSIPIRNPAVLARKIIDDEMVIVNADTSASLALTNQTAVVVWEMVSGRNTVQDIIDGVKSTFQAVPDSVTDDVLALLDLLDQDGFIGFELDKNT